MQCPEYTFVAFRISNLLLIYSLHFVFHRYNLLSNDNGFISYPPSFFRQRTLLARFQVNHSHPRKVEFVKKPVLGVMGLLALLGDQQIKSLVTPENNANDFGVMASVRKPQYFSNISDWELAAILYNSNDTSGRTSISKVNVTIVNLPLKEESVFVVYNLDNGHGSPFQVWQQMGSPVFPTDDQFKELRLHQVF